MGLNYKSHVEETGRNDSDYPVLFPKFASSLAGPFDTISLPGESAQVDYEGELAVVVGKPGRRIRRTPPLYLKPGDVVSVEVTGVGTLRTTIS